MTSPLNETTPSGKPPVHAPLRPAPDHKRETQDTAATCRQHTEAVLIGGEELAPQVCSECNQGGYTPIPGREGRPVYKCTADCCDHTVDHSAFDLYTAEHLVMHDDRLHLARPYDAHTA